MLGPNGHLSNNAAGQTISHLMNTGLKSVMLGHLSKENNFPELAYKTVVNEILASNNSILASTLESNISLNIATRYDPTPLISII